MPTPRRRTTENKFTGVMGATRRAVNAARFSGELRPDERRAEMYRSDVPHAPDARVRINRLRVSPQERAALTERIRVLYVEKGWSVLDIECDIDRSNTFIRSIIAENGFVKGKREK